MNEFDLKIVTPEKVCYDGKASSVLVTTDVGEVQILAGHADYIASLSTGRAKITLNNESFLAASSRGIVTVKNGKVTIVAVTFEFGKDIDIKRAERAKEKSEDVIKNPSSRSPDEVEYAKAKLLRALTRISVYNNSSK